MRHRRFSRRDLVRLMAVGGAGFLASPLTAGMFDDLGLAGEARRAGFGDPGDGAPKGPPASWGRLRFRCTGGDDLDWNVHPHGDLNLIRKIAAASTVNLHERWNVADIAQLDQLTRFPMLFMHADSAAELKDAEIANLREYLTRGGFLYAEDCVNGKNHHGQGHGQWDFFFQSVKPVLENLVPGAVLARLSDDHEIFHCFYDLPAGQPHMQGKPHGAWGLTLRGRLLAYLSPSDAHCGWTNPIWFGERRAQEAVKIGTNVYVYAMTH